MQDQLEPNSGFNMQVKKYLPGAALLLLTVSLMFFFKHNKKDISNYIEEGTGSLVNFYTQNLKPLLFQTDITNEDIFNFALYQRLPIDKNENKVLQLNDSAEGYELFSIKPEDKIAGTDNYKQFIEYMDLTPTEKAGIDSVLDSYKEDLYSSILVNETKAVAVNPRIVDLQKAIVADISLFTQSTRKSRDVEIPFPTLSIVNIPEVTSMIDVVKKTVDNDFIVFAPDTVFTEEFDFDRAKLKKELARVKFDIEAAKEELKNLKVSINVNNESKFVAIDSMMDKMHFRIDSANFAVALPRVKRVENPELTNLSEELRKVNKALRAISFSSNGNIHIKVDTGIDGQNLGESFEFNLNIDSIIKSSLQFIDEADLKELKELKYNLDDLNIDSVYKSRRPERSTESRKK